MAITIEELKTEVEERTGLKINLSEVRKNNDVVLHGFSIKDKKISPCIYVDDIIQDYSDVSSAAEAVISDLCVNGRELDEVIRTLKDIDKEYVLRHTEYSLCNKEKNAKLAENSPHRDLLDLTIFYRCSLLQEDNASFLIQNDFAKSHDITQEELEKAASENAKKKDVRVIPINQAIREEAGSDDVGYEELHDVFVITNRSKFRGAWVLTCTPVLEKLANDLASDLFLLPSSIHEIIAIPAVSSVKKVKEMVDAVNDTFVNHEDYLSGSVYHWSREKSELTIAK